MKRRACGLGLLLAVTMGCLAAAPEPPRPRSLIAAPALDEREGEDRWAVVIGISAYRRTDLNLRYAADDARDFARALEQHCGFRADHIRLLTDGEATAPAIRTALGTWLPRVAGRNDTVVVFYSGHGSPDLDGNVTEDGVRKYLVTHDADPRDLFATAVPLEDVSAALMRVRSERTVLLLDACFSGGALQAGAAALPRGFHASGMDLGGRVTGAFADNLARSGRGRAVLTACAPSEKSFEYGDLRHGIFTHFVLEGLAGKAAGADGTVTVTGLYEHVWRALQEPGENRERQTPLLATSVAGTLTLTRRQGAAGPANGRLRILSSPLGAAVFVGRAATPLRTPAELDLPEGLHDLAVFKEGFNPVAEQVYVPGGQTRTVSVVLPAEQKRGDLLVQSVPGAAVSVDGRPAGAVGPDGLLRLPDLEAGARRIRLEAPERRPVEREVTVLAGRPVAERFDLERALRGVRSATGADVPPGLEARGDRYVWSKDGAEMVFVSEGPFFMGDDADLEARPRREVTLPAFWIDRHEVTNAQFAAFVAATAHRPAGGWAPAPPERARRPATRVSLDDARAYARWAGKSLPTEEQWEKAARSPDGRPFPYGSQVVPTHQNLKAFGLRDLLDVGSFPRGAGPYGALDLLGNAWEWCDSPFNAYPGNGAQQPNFGKGHYVLRGGSYLTPAVLEGFTAATRSFLRPNIGQEDVGFRCVVSRP